MLWTAVPALSLWTASKLSATTAQHYLLALPLTVAAMIVWGALLFALNACYLRLADLSAPNETTQPPRSPLEAFLVWSLLIAFIAFLVWFFAFAKNPPPGIEL
jgi:hypothetical protein